MTAVATASLKNAIRNHLIELGKAGPFYLTAYDADGFVKDLDTDVDKTVKPSTCVANEVSSAYEPDAGYGRDVAQRRTSWLFELHLAFDREVTLELFETSLMRPVPRVTVEGLSSVFLRLTGTDYEHPPSQQASSGTSVVYTFDASAGRL